MNYFLLKLAFDTAVHFGGSDSAVGSQSSALTLRADTIFFGPVPHGAGSVRRARTGGASHLCRCGRPAHQ